MKKPYNSFINIPEGIECKLSDEGNILKCIKNGVELKRVFDIVGTDVKVENNKVKLNCAKANKKNIAMIKTNLAHVKNMFKGLEENYVYNLEICNVHFPMTAKVEGNKFVVSNFLGEKQKRNSRILEGVEVEIKGQQVTVKGSDIEKAGQTAANIEKSVKVPKKDRRIFQDGIFITSKPGGKI